MTGKIYRVVMRLGHRFGWCFPRPVAVEPGYVWCHWCGMRGRRPDLRAASAVAEMQRKAETL